MSYEDIGYDSFLSREQDDNPQLTLAQADLMVAELSGENIIGPQGTSYKFTPTAVPTTPTEGETYYDQNEKKLKVFTGSSFETVTSTV